MRRSFILVPLITGAIGLATLGCGDTKPPPAPQAPQEPTAPPPPGAAPVAVAPPAKEAAPATGPAAVPAVKAAPKAPMGTASAEPVRPAAAPPVPAPAKEPAPVAAPPKPPAPPPAAPPAEPSKGLEAPAASPHAKLGAEKCMMCHKVQYASWNQSKHKAKGLDCEGCHGNGADYKSIAVMKDRAAAIKAGLILPGLAFCKKCHVKGDASLLPLVHAHKAK